MAATPTVSAQRRVRLPGYIVALHPDPEADDPPADDPEPEPGEDEDGTAPEASGHAWADLPTAPQPVVTPQLDAPPPGRRRTVLTGLFIGICVAVAVVLAGSSLLPLLQPPQDGRTPANGPAGPDGSAAPATSSPYTVSAPVGAIRTAEFQLAAGVTALVVRATDLGDDLYRVATPESSGFVPRVEQDNAQVRLRLARLDDTDGGGRVTVELNTRVRWRINLVGGSESVTVDVRAADLAGVDFVGGVARIELWLPEPQGEVAVRMSGGVRDFVVHAPGSVPFRVRLARGAGTVTVDEATRSRIARGTRITQRGWNEARDRYDIDAVAGLGLLTVDRY
jgi:hypothetical protein